MTTDKSACAADSDFLTFEVHGYSKAPAKENEA
jgi:hypothetical protein